MAPPVRPTRPLCLAPAQAAMRSASAGRAAGELRANRGRQRGEKDGLLRLASDGGALALPGTGLGVGQRFRFRGADGLRRDKDALAFVALTGARPLHHDGPQR